MLNKNNFKLFSRSKKYSNFKNSILKFLLSKTIIKNFNLDLQLVCEKNKINLITIVFFTQFFSNLTSWKKYLQEKYWSQKEKAARAKTWAWKHEGTSGTYKGFYIPAALPQTDQAKFFLKKRDEDEQKLRDRELAKFSNKFKFNASYRESELGDPRFWDVQKN